MLRKSWVQLSAAPLPYPKYPAQGLGLHLELLGLSRAMLSEDRVW